MFFLKLNQGEFRIFRIEKLEIFEITKFPQFRIFRCFFNPDDLTIELFPHLSCIRRHEGIWQKFWAHAVQPTVSKNNFRCWSAHGDCARKDPS